MALGGTVAGQTSSIEGILNSYPPAGLGAVWQLEHLWPAGTTTGERMTMTEMAATATVMTRTIGRIALQTVLRASTDGESERAPCGQLPAH